MASRPGRAKSPGPQVEGNIRGVEPDALDDYYSYQHDTEVENAVKRRKAVHEDELLAESELGQLVLKLRPEKEYLLDTVWLAASTKQIKELRGKVAELVNDEQTQLQRAALTIAPVEE